MSEAVGVISQVVPFLARDIMVDAPPIAIDTVCGRAVTLFVERPDLPCIAIVDPQGRPLGVVSRERMMSTFAQQLLADLYRRRPIMSFLETAFLAVDQSMDIDDISELIANDHPRALTGGFVITRKGLYKGIGTGVGLLSKAVVLTTMRERELESARFAAVSANRAKSTFLASMSHEIRTPLNGVVGNLELLRYTDCDAEQADLIASANAAAQTLLQIIGDVLDFSKIESDRIEVESLDTPTLETVGEVVQLFTSKARQRGLDLIGRVGAGVPRIIRGDPLRLRQVVMNFVGNSVKFTERGAITVTLTRVWRRDGVWLRYQVMDTGIGFRTEKAPDLFEAFTQEDGSTTRRFGGTGLGLAICKRLVELMGGEVGADGAPGEGAAFWFDVPVEVVEDPEAVALPDLTGLLVLVIDGGAGGNRAAVPLLECAGARADVADDLLSAMAAVRGAEIRGHAYDVVVLDDVLPDGNAFVIAEALANGPARIVLTVADDDRAFMRAGLRRGLSCIVAKPCPPEEVALAVAEAAGRTQNRLTPAAEQSDDLSQVAGDFPDRCDGLPLLVIDDTPMNRSVARRQLARLGLSCDEAGDGREGLERATAGRYALILVDGSMPVMDGYEFTRRLRAWEAERGVRTPIIAMTAHALADDAQKSLDAGMDDHLTKPVTIGRLAAALDRWLGTALGSAGSAAGHGAATATGHGDTDITAADAADGAEDDTADAPAIDLAALSAILGGADDDEIDEVLTFFAETFDGLMERLRLALSAGDAVALRNAAHSAKSAARNAGAVRLGDRLAEIETAVQRIPWDRMGTLVAAAGTDYAAVRGFIAGRTADGCKIS